MASMPPLLATYHWDFQNGVRQCEGCA